MLTEVMAFVSTTDLDRALAFYDGVLGLELIDRTEFACVFLVGTTTLRVTLAEQVDPAPYTVLGWIVPDIDDEMARLVTAGLMFERYPGMTGDNGVWIAPSGDKIAWFKDPDRNVLSLTEFV